MENIENVVEAIIFASGSAIARTDIIEKVPELTHQKLNSIVRSLQKRYSGESGIVLLDFNGKLQFSSNPVYGDTVADVLTPLKEKELTRTLLEVLSTVAYKQPITRLEIDDMRGGTNSEYALSGLLKAGLVQAVGRKDTVGRPLLYGTTDEFLKKFGLSDITDLPDYSEVLEKLMLIDAPISDSLFHNRSILDGDEGEGDGDGEAVKTPDDALEEAASDAETAPEPETDDFFDDDDELPDLLIGEDIDTYE